MAGAIQERNFERLSKPKGERKHPRLVWGGRADLNPVEVQRLEDNPKATVLVVFDMFDKSRAIGHTEVEVPPVITSKPNPDSVKDYDAYISARTRAIAELKIKSFRIIDSAANEVAESTY